MSRRVCLIAFAAVAMSGCQSTRVATIDTKHTPQSLASDESKLWKQAEYVERRAEEIGLVYSNALVEAYLQSVAAQLVGDRLENPQDEVRIRILRLPSRNAIMFSNGVLWITTGMLACLDDEAELAAVMGHELTHFLRRHALKETRSATNKQLLVDIFTGATAVAGLAPLLNAAGSAWAETAVLGYSRDLENEADERAVEELARAGYDLSAALRVLEHLREEDEDEGEGANNRPGTHPQFTERMQRTHELLADRYAALVGDATRRIDRAEYLTHVQPVLLESIKLDLAYRRLDFAEEVVVKYIVMWPNAADGYFWRGEICRHRPELVPLDQVESDYRAATGLDPDFAPAHRELGLLYRADGRLEEARMEFAAYVALSANAADACTFERYLAELDAEIVGQPMP